MPTAPADNARRPGYTRRSRLKAQLGPLRGGHEAFATAEVLDIKRLFDEYQGNVKETCWNNSVTLRKKISGRLTCFALAIQGPEEQDLVSVRSSNILLLLAAFHQDSIAS